MHCTKQISKFKKQKQGLAECRPSKCEALSPNPTSAKKKNKETTQSKGLNGATIFEILEDPFRK
jgi:hypothetical protein